MREKMTEKEREQLKALQAKEKRVQRAEADFLQEADERKDELLKRWGIVSQKNTKSRAAQTPQNMPTQAPVPAPAPAPAPAQPSFGPLEFDQL